MKSATSRLLDMAANHDSNEERRYIRTGEHLNITWSWLWTNWAFGGGADYERHGQEPFSTWAHLGPFTLELYWRR